MSRIHAVACASLLGLSLSPRLRAQEEPRTEAKEDEGARQAREKQTELLKKYNLQKAPDLSKLGLKLEDGLYRWDPPQDDSLYPDPERFGELIEKSLKQSHREGARQEHLAALGRLPGDPQLRTLTDRQLAFLANVSQDPQHAKQFEDTGRLGQLAASLRGAPEERIVDALASVFQNEGARGRFSRHWDTSEDPIASLRGSSSHGHSGWRDALRSGGGSPAPERYRSFHPSEPPPPGMHSVLRAVSDPGMDSDRLEYGHELGEYMRRRDPAEIARLKEQLLPLTGFSDPETRSKALYLLGLTRDEKLAPLFLKAMSDAELNPRVYAARAIGGILGTFKASSPGADWSAFLQKAPPLMSALAGAPNALELGEARKALTDNLGHLNLMSDKQKAQFVGSLKDPKAPLLFIGASSSQGISETRGLHSSEARSLFQQFKQLAPGQPVSRTLEKEAMSPESSGRILNRLHRYDLLAGELKNDPGLSKLLPELMFKRETYLSGMEPAEVFSLAKLMAKTNGAGFAGDLISRIQGPDDPKFDKEGALLYLGLNQAALPAGQREQVRSLLQERLSADMQKKIQDSVHAPFYGHWPEDKLNVSLVMTQANHAYDFIRTLEQNGYKREGQATRTKDTVQRINLASGKVSLRMDILPSKPDGWVLDRDLLQKTLSERYQDPGSHVVIYRGHAGEYDPHALGALETKGKVFMDLSCNSDYDTKQAVANCKDCGFYGTTTVGRGAVNNVFVNQMLKSLSSRESYPQIEERLQREMPTRVYGFTGSSSQTGAWAELTRDLSSLPETPASGGTAYQLMEQIRLLPPAQRAP